MSLIKPKKCPRLLYSKETLKEALAAIKSGMPINTASNKYQIPRSTLHNKKTAKYADKRPGPDTVLTASEENSLVQWIFICSKHHIFVSKQHLLNSVALLVKLLNRENPFANGRPGRHWYQSFLRRHSNVSDRINENSMITRNPACEIGLKRWFVNCRTYLEEKNLLDINPSRIFSTESVLLLSPDANEEKENLSLHLAGNAVGQIAPPMVLFTYQRIPSKIYEKLPTGWACSKSENGCMTSETLYEYVTKTFYPWIVDNKIELPVILFMDGRVPHLTLSLSDFCLRNKIELVALHPNSLHILEPLDVSLFSHIKAAWRTALNDYRTSSKINLSKENVTPVLKSIFDNLNIANILIDGFKTCGLCPLSEDIINYDKVPKKVTEKVKPDRIEFTPYIPEDLYNTYRIPVQVGSVTNVEFLHYMEQALDADTVQEFKAVHEFAEWPGKIEDTGLFNFWRKISNSCKTDAENFNPEQNLANTKYELENDDAESFHSEQNSENTKYKLENVAEQDIDLDFINEDGSEMIDIVEDPLKICVAEMEEA